MEVAHPGSPARRYCGPLYLRAVNASQRLRDRHNTELRDAVADLRDGLITMKQYIAITSRIERERQRTNAAGLSAALGTSVVALSPRRTAARRRGAGRPATTRSHARASAHGDPDPEPPPPALAGRSQGLCAPTSPARGWSR